MLIVIPAFEARFSRLQPLQDFCQLPQFFLRKNAVCLSRNFIRDVLDRLEDAVNVRGFDAHTTLV